MFGWWWMGCERGERERFPQAFKSLVFCMNFEQSGEVSRIFEIGRI